MALDEGQCTEAPWGAASTKAIGPVVFKGHGSCCAWIRVSNGRRGQGAEDVGTESAGMNK